MVRKAIWLLLGLSLALAFSALGRWQLGRAVEKEVLLAASAHVLAERAPHRLSSLSALSSDALAWVRDEGQLLEVPVLLLDNQRRGDAVGVQVYRVLTLDSGPAVLVDFGWLPLPPDRTLPTFTDTIGGVYSVQGLLAPPPSSGLAMGPDHVVIDTTRWLLTRMDIPALSEALQRPLSNRVLRLDPALPGGYTRDLEQLPNTLTPEKHRGYALQWFGLALACVTVTLILLLRKRRP